MSKKTKNLLKNPVFWIIVILLIGLAIWLIIYFTNKTGGSKGSGPGISPTPLKKLDTPIQVYLSAIYPSSEKITNFSAEEAESYYKNLWFYYLVTDWLGVPSTVNTKTGKSIIIKGTLVALTDLVPNEYVDGAPFFHPNSVAIKNIENEFYTKSGISGTKTTDMLKAISNGKYIEISSFGWNSFPNGIYLNSAIGSGIFWDPGNIAVGPNKLALIYMFACQILKVEYVENTFTTTGYAALNKMLKKYDTTGNINKLLKKIQQDTKSNSIQDVIKFHVVDDRQFLSQASVVGDEAVIAYDETLKTMGLVEKYDSCMMAAQANGDGSFDIEFCDFRVTINGSFSSGTIDDDIQGKWEVFHEKYLSIRDPFDIDNTSKARMLEVVFPTIMFSGEDATYMCKAGPNCGAVIENSSRANLNKSCSLMGCSPADTPGSWKRGQTLNIYKSGAVNLYTPGGVSFAINNAKSGLSMINISQSTSRIISRLKNHVYPALSATDVKSLTSNTDLSTFLKILNITNPSSISDGLRNYLKLTYPLSSKLWDTSSQNDMATIYMTLNAHYMPLLLPIGKMTIPKCYSPSECVFPPSKNSRTQLWSFDGAHITGASPSDIGKKASSTKNYPDSTPYWYQHVGNPFNGGSHSAFDKKSMTLTEGGFPNYAWVESVQYADESGGKRLAGKYDEVNKVNTGPESCDCVPNDDCTTFIQTPEGFELREGFDDDQTCDPAYTPPAGDPKNITCPIGQVCMGKLSSSYCNIPDAYTDCAITYHGQTPPGTSICGSFDDKTESWVPGKCAENDQCKWALASDMDQPQSQSDLFDCIKTNTDNTKCGLPWSVQYKDTPNVQNIPVITTMYYPQMGYGRFTNYGKTGIFYSNVSVLLTIPDLNLRMTMEQIIQLVGSAVGGLSIYHQLEALLDKTQKDNRQFLTGYVVLPNHEYNSIPNVDKAKIYNIQNKRSVICETPLINPGDDPRLSNIQKNFTPLYIPPEANIKNPQYKKTLDYEYETAIQLLMAMYIHGCTGNHSKTQNYPFGSYNSYGMSIGHLAYVRTIAMGWNTLQLARDPDYGGNSMKYCEWPFYDYEIIHVAAKPPSWFKPTMAKAKNKDYPDETDGYGFDLSVGGVWADSGASKNYVFCKGMFTLDITLHLSFYLVNGYLPGSGIWDEDVKMFNPIHINRNIFRQGQLGTDVYAKTIRPYYTPTTWGSKPILYDMTCPFPEWNGILCDKSNPACVATKKGQGIYYQAMHSTTPMGAWPLGTPVGV